MRWQREAMIRKGMDSNAKASMSDAKERLSDAVEPHGLERLGCGYEWNCKDQPRMLRRGTARISGESNGTDCDAMS